MRNKSITKDYYLNQLGFKEVGDYEGYLIIEKDQINDFIITKLWELGLMPGSDVAIKVSNEQFVELEVNGRLVKVPRSLSGKISVVKYES